jgi:Concanavalin A-like lectin/glucanases superfamily/Domain of unknown function (DUF1929)/Bacterial Ig domain/Glyoxal oxidase N-terminus/Fibronectin type III domain
MTNPEFHSAIARPKRLSEVLRNYRIALLVLVGVVAGISGSVRAQTQSGLVAAYSFDEGSGTNANDGSGNSLTATVTNTTWTGTAKFGTALAFNGNNSWVSVPDFGALDLTSGMTLEAWVYPTALGAGVWRNVLIKERSGGEIFNLYANADTNAPALFVVQDPKVGSIGLRGTSPLPLNTWSHLAATYDNVTLRLYVNGVVVASRSLTGPLLPSTGPVRVGGNSVWGEFFQGSIDEVRIYNRALTQTQIQTDMTTPLGLAPPPPPPPGADVVGEWSPVVDWPLVAIHMSLLPTGQVMMWDGFGFNPGSARLWDPSTGNFTSEANIPNIFCSGHVLLPDGRLLVAGGHVAVDVGIRDATIFDAVAGSWTSGAQMAFARWYPTVTALPDGRALVMSGNQNCSTCNADTPEVYDPTAGTWTRLNSARRTIPLYPFNFILPDGRLLVGGSYHSSMATPVLDVTAQSWTTMDATVLDAGSAVMYAPGRIMKSGSSWELEGTSTPAAATTYVLDTTQPSPRWRQTAPMAFPRIWHNSTVLPDGNVLVTGGGQTADEYNVSAASLAAEMWSPVTEQWTTMATSQVPRFYHSTALLLPDGRVVVAGSGRDGVDQLSAEIYSPPYLFKGARPSIGSAPSQVGYGSSFAVQTPDAARIAKVSLIRLGSVTHAIDGNQRLVPLSFQTSGGALMVQAPANGNLAPPGHYMLFLVDNNGVPSTATILRLPTPAEDLQPPTVAITSPGNGSSVSGTITVTATASDNKSVAGVRFRVDGVDIGPEDTTNPFSISWNSASVVNGSHTLVAIARDAAGNTAVSANVTVVVTNTPDTSPPTVPTGVTATAVSASQINVAWTASSDNVGVAGYTIFRNDAAVGSVTGPTFADTGLQPSTTYRYTVAARDGVGNLSAPSSPPVTATTPSSNPGLVAAYGFNEGSGTSVADATGNGHTGTISGAIWTTQGRFGQALSFPGSSSWVTVSDSALLDLTTGMTLEAWVNPTALGTSWRNVIIKERAAGEIYNLYAHTDALVPTAFVVTAAAPNSPAGVSGGTQLALNTWSHLAVTYDGTALRLYVNGTQVGSRALSGALLASTGALRIGGNSLWGEFFQGSIDEVRIYNRALSPAELQSDMNTPVGGTPPDTTPPVRSNGAPSGTLVAGTAQTVLSLTTSENTICRYATTAGVAYASMPNTFSTTGGTAHSTTVSGLTNGSSYSFYVRCQDTAANANPDDFTISFSVAPTDTAPPTRTNGAPTGILPAGTTQTVLSLTTNENATCRYATTAGVAYGSMSNTFATTGGMTHSTTVSGLTNGAGYSFYVRCQDTASNANPDDFTISFAVAQPVDTTPPLRFNGAPTGTLPAATTQATLSLTTNENATCRYATTAGVAYGSMPNTFATTGATAHSTTVAGLTNGGSYTFYVRCQDAASNANPDDLTISFSVAPGGGDTTPPLRFNGAPTGTLPAGTTQATLSLTTDENATCRYATTSVGYASMPNAFSTTGGTTHSTTVTGLTNGGSYIFYVRCQDVALNPDPGDFVISFGVADPSLVAAYSLNEGSGTTVADASGHGLVGTIAGATWTTQGRFGNALSFNGTNSWVTVPSNAALNLTNRMTLEAWVFPTAHGGLWRDVLIKERSNGEVYNLYSNTDAGVPAAFAVRSAAPGSPVGAIGTSSLPLNLWTHLAVTYDGSKLRLYVNGVQVADAAMTGSMVSSSGALRIGGNSVWGEYFQGQIDEIRIYNRALSQAQIQVDMTKPIAP